MLYRRILYFLPIERRANIRSCLARTYDIGAQEGKSFTKFISVPNVEAQAYIDLKDFYMISVK